jgi:hypothetical protein
MTLEADFKRFCGLHSWYKHIPIHGAYFYAFLAQGEQPRNGICAEVTDTEGMHWHFSMRKPTALTSYKVRFGPFLRGIEAYTHDNMPITRGFNIIVSDAGEAWAPWIKQNYPHLENINWNSRVEWSEPHAIEELYRTEYARYWNTLSDAVEAQEI